MIDTEHKTLLAPSMLTKRKYLILAFFLLLAWVITYPTLFSPFSQIPGDGRSDVWDHLWGYWRTEKAFFVEHQFPYQERHMNHPEGGVLYHVDLLNSFFMLPLRFLFGMAASYNLLVWGHLVGAAFAMYMLARRFVTHQISAVFAGVAFAFSPYMLSLTLASGVANRLNIAWIPLFFLCYFQLLEEGKRPIRNIAFAALMFLFATLGCWLYGLYVFMLCALLSIFVLLRPVIERKKEKLGLHYRDLILKKMLPLAVACGLAGIPIGLSASGSVSGDSSGIYQREHHMFWDGVSELQIMNEFGVMDFFMPYQQGLLVTSTFDMLYQTVYLGYGLLALALLSLFSRKRYSFFFLPTALIFFVLALGPKIVLFKGSNSIDSPIFGIFARIVPYMTAHEVPWEFILPGIFCAAIAAAMGVDWLLSTIRSDRWRWVGGIELMAILLLENTIISPAIFPVPSTKVHVPAFYTQLAKESDDFAVFDFPTRRANSMLIPTEYFYYQTVHHKPIPYAVQKSWMDTHQFWIEFTRRQQGQKTMSVMDQFGTCRAGSSFGCGTSDKVRNSLAREKFRYFIVHLRLLNKDDHKDYLMFFQKMFGEIYHRDEELVVFRIQ